MELMKIIFTIAITMAVTITLTMRSIVDVEEKPPFEHIDTSNIITKDSSFHEMKLMPSKSVSRFLAGQENPRAADHCHKDNERCYVLHGYTFTSNEAKPGYNSTCCNNKCMDLTMDKNNCGKCKKKCEYTEHCCGGKCVELAFDKRHCGRCNNRCNHGEYCVYGMCDYA